MKKLLSLFLILATVSVFAAVNWQVWYKGVWESTTQYNVQPIPNSSNKIAQMVYESQNSKFYITSGASTPIKGAKPESDPAAWLNITGS